MRRRSFLGLASAIPLVGETVRLDADGMTMVEGRRQFLLGSYQLPKRGDGWIEAQAAGFHVVHTAAKREELDRATAAGLKAWVTVGSDPAEIGKVAAGLKDHPALLFWENEDEPSYQYKKPGPRVTPQRMIAAYRQLRAADPSRPVYLNHSPTNLVSTLRQYNDAADILATDIYPVAPRGLRGQYALWEDGLHGDLLNPYISQVGQYADKLRAVGGPAKGLFMVLQAFAWEGLRKEGDRNPKLIQYPTQAELRFMCFQSIVHGATGLLWWGLHTVPDGERFWDDLKGVVRELRSLSPELSAAGANVDLRIEYHDLGHSVDRGIEWIAKPSKDGPLIIAVNADRWPVEATLHLGARSRRVSLSAFGVALIRGL